MSFGIRRIRACFARWTGGNARAFALAAALLPLLAVLAVLVTAPAHAGTEAGTSIVNIATATYVPAGFMQTETARSNAVQASIQPVEALRLTADQSLVRPPFAPVTLSHLLTNTGNMPSSYTFDIAREGAGCGSSALALSDVRMVRDMNNNGVVDAGDQTIAAGQAGTLSLRPGESAPLLVQGSLPNVPAGTACLVLSVRTDAQDVRASNTDIITIGAGAAVQLTKSASYPGNVLPGKSRIDFKLNATNVGASDAQPSAALANGAGAASIIVNGRAMALLLLRDTVPSGTHYVPGSLASATLGAIRLYRYPGDAPFTYRTAEDASAVEVAIGVPSALVRNGSMAMAFSVLVNAEHSGGIQNIGQIHYSDGAAPATALSNTVVIEGSNARIGVAKAASAVIVGRDASGALDGTIATTFRIRVKNYGPGDLYELQTADVLEGASASQFGTYTAASVPAAGQYTIVPGSLRLAATSGGARARVNSGFTGQAALSGLLDAGAYLPAVSDITIEFDVRVNAGGRAATLLNSATASAALVAGGPAQVSDVSTAGSDPDPDGDGDPANNSVPTPLTLAAPSLSFSKSASLPRRVADGVYDIDYSFRVTNSGSATAPFVRVIDNLDCTFGTGEGATAIASWELVGGVRSQSGTLQPAKTFTGRAACNREALASDDPFVLPADIALSLTDGTRSLAPGQSETLSVTARVTEKPSAVGSRVVVTNKAWAAAFTQNALNLPASATVAATAATVQSLLIDPSGTVYNSVTRAPIAGAIVTFSRVSCSTGTLGPIMPAEIYAGNSGVYTYNADGSLSMTTGADGSYQFHLNAPPVSGICTYAVKVTPPAGSGYVTPSAVIAVTPGTFTSCGSIVGNAGPPQGSDSTTYHDSVAVGLNGDGTLCEALHNHFPLDPGNVRGLILAKGGSKSTVEIGDFVDYALVLTNKTGFPVRGATFSDTLPAGFAYVPGSSSLIDATGSAPARIAEPEGGKGPTLSWKLPEVVLDAEAKVTLRYRARVGIGAPGSGTATNRASVASGPLSSNVATFSVRMAGGVFSDDGFLIGKVYMACSAPGIDGRVAGQADRAIAQDGKAAVGVPGVRLFLEDGTSVVTDGEGKWSLYGLKPITHVIRIDQTSLPAGTAPALRDNRNAFDAQSRFVDLKSGQMQKADFPLTGCADPAAMADVAARRKEAAQRGQGEADLGSKARLDPTATTAPVGDRRSLSAAGGASMNTAPISQIAAPAPLIALPAAPKGGNAFISGVGSSGSGMGTLTQAQAGSPTGAPAHAAKPVKASTAQPAGNSQPAASPPAAPHMAEQTVDLEALLPKFDQKLAFVGVVEGDTVASATTNIRVKGPAAGALSLSVNGTAIDEKRVGKKLTLPSTGVAAWEYVGIQLKPGTNLLRLEARDGFGNVRGEPVELHVLAPGRLGALGIDVPARSFADGRTPIPVKLRLTDAEGLPVTDRTQVTIEVEGGRWAEEDLNPTEPGSQYFVTGGEAVFHLIPPTAPGNMRLRASAGPLSTDKTLVLVPEMRPLIGVGIVEGVIDLTKRGKLAVGQEPASQAFEQDLSRVAGNGEVRAGGRAAFFFKGTILGKYLLTAAADSNKKGSDRLFRDIRPDEFYPIYGDSSARGFDAQSTQKVYVRIDRDRSFLLYGDFISASSPEVRLLSQSNRSLTGIKAVSQSDNGRTTVYAAKTTQRQQIEEFAGKGVSGPYYLRGGGADAAGGFVENSEKIELLVRDRNQPSLVLKTTSLQRFVDYTLEPLTRRILFAQPIASLDANLNPQSIRVTYEVDSGGPSYLVAGADAQVKFSESLQLGAVATIDDTPDNRRRLGGLTALARIGKNTTVSAEAVVTDSDLRGKGTAARVELQYQDEKLGVGVRAARSSAGFDNPASSMTAGRTEASARAEYRASPTLTVRAEGVYSENASDSASAKGVMLSAQKQLGAAITGELGLRYGSATSGTASLFDYGQASLYSGTTGGTSAGLSGTDTATPGQADSAAVRARLTARVPGLKRAQVFVEGEQDLVEGDRHTLSLGGTYGITDKMRAYGRYTLDSSLGGDYTLSSAAGRNLGVVGIESAVFGSGKAYNEYRIADALDERTAQNAIGLRNGFSVSKTLRLTGGIEYVHAVGAKPAEGTIALGQGDAISFTSGFEYLTPALKASGVLEGRLGQDADTWLGSGGIGYKISEDWSLLARGVYSSSTGKGQNAGTSRILSREQIGLAWRPVDSDVWNALLRYEHRSELIRGGSSDILVGTVSGSAFGSNALLPGSYITDILAGNLNINPEPRLEITAHIAAKLLMEDTELSRSRYFAQLGQIRLVRDLDDRWDIGIQGALMHGSDGAWKKSLGLEVGYLLGRNLWLSAGYNVVGLYERDLTAGNYTSQGLFLRLRLKFGEGVLALLGADGAKPAAAAPEAAAPPAPTPTPAQPTPTGAPQ